MANESQRKAFEYDVVEDLSTWEFINPSNNHDDDDDFEDHYSFDEQIFASNGDHDHKEEKNKSNVVIGPKEEGPNKIGPKEGGPNAIESPSSHMSMPSLLDEMRYLLEIDYHVIGEIDLIINDKNGNDDHDRHEDVMDDGHDDGYHDEDDLDDELVPMCVRTMLDRERMKKLGKRDYSRMYKSKKLSLFYNRPGCVHGKHGLGMHHNLI